MNRREFMKVGSLFAAGGLLAKVGQIELNDETTTPVLERVEISIRNLKPALRRGLTLIGLARELDRGVVGCRAPWFGQLARAP